MARNNLHILQLLKKAEASPVLAPVSEAPVPSPNPNEGALGGNTSITANHDPTTNQQAKSPVSKTPALPSRDIDTPTPGAAIAATSPAKTSGSPMQTNSMATSNKFAAVEIPSGREMPQPGQQQQPEEGVDQTVKRKMQYRWKDKMQKIDQGMAKLDLQRQQAGAEMQLEEQQLQQTEQLKSESKAFDNSLKEQQRQKKINEVMPQHPMGMPGQDQGHGMQQQQPGMARQQQPQGQGAHQMPKMASEERLQSALNTLWNKSEIDAESYEKGYRDGKVSLEDIELLAKGHAGDSDLYSEGSKPYAMKQASEDKWTRRTKKITNRSENMILKIAEEEDWDLGDEAAGFAGTVGGMFAGGAAGRELGGQPGMMVGAIGGSLLGNVVAVAIERAARRKKNILQPPTGVGFMI